jgi:mannosyl-glycoprotein endo-beta-N-acetylglucosaminidase
MSGEEKDKYSSLPLSTHYARLLAQLAANRGFDGYLLNFECPLQGGVEQCRALAAWISLLRVELQKQVGPYAEVIWYCLTNICMLLDTDMCSGMTL